MQLEIHVLQSFPPANLNRDENGMPKSTVFGGRTRARISSQCQKRATRQYYQEYGYLEDSLFAKRSSSEKWIVEIAKQLTNKGIQSEKVELVASSIIGFFTTKKEILFLGNTEVDAMVNLVFTNWGQIENDLSVFTPKTSENIENIINKIENLEGSEQTTIINLVQEIMNLLKEITEEVEQVQPKLAKEINTLIEKIEQDTNGENPKLSKTRINSIKKIGEKLLNTAPTLSNEIKKGVEKVVNTPLKPGDVALYGRMMASLPSGKVDAAVQVAHAISVNALKQDFDFFTAVDELADSQSLRAGHLGEMGFNSSTYYRYAVLDSKQLMDNLDQKEDLASKIAEEFAKAFIKSVPSGHKSQCAPHTRPQAIMLVVRKDQPFSLANAFENPISPSNKLSLMGNAIKALDTHWENITEMYGESGIKYKGITIDADFVDSLTCLKDCRVKSLDKLLQEAIKAIFN